MALPQPWQYIGLSSLVPPARPDEDFGDEMGFELPDDLGPASPPMDVPVPPSEQTGPIRGYPRFREGLTEQEIEEMLRQWRENTAPLTS
jgi:hypothetical protein